MAREIPTNPQDVRDDITVAWQNLAEQIRTRREELGMSQGALSLVARVSRGTIKNAERGQPLESRSLAFIQQALGYAPRTVDQVLRGAEPREILTADIMRAIASLFVGRPELTVPKAMLDDFHQLVSAMADDPPALPPSFERLRTALRHVLSIKEMWAFDKELASRVGDAYPYGAVDAFDVDLIPPRAHDESTPGLGRGLGALLPREAPLSTAELNAVLDSGLPNDVQKKLIELASARRRSAQESMDAMLLEEMRLLIAQIKSLTSGFLGFK